MARAFAVQVPDQGFNPSFIDQVLTDDDQSSCAANEGPSPRPIVAHDRVGAAYFGNLVSDILDYRELRNRELRAEELGDAERDDLARLEKKLRQPPGDDDDDCVATRLRSFFRYECGFPAELRSAEGHFSVSVEDISAGGVKVRSEHAVTPGDPVFLLIPTSSDDHNITFPSRIAWVRNDTFGVMFAGAARRAPGIAASGDRPGDTK